MGDPVRLKILCQIIQTGGLCVTDLASRLDLSVAITSHHLRTLVKDGVLVSQKDGRCVYYQFTNDSLTADLRNLICRYK